MKFTLVQPALIRREANSLTPPLGLLTLGAVLREESVDVEIVDYNLRGFQSPEFLDSRTFYDEAAREIVGTSPSAVGFTSMALESPATLELAKRVKQLAPEIDIVLGGPHFGSIAPVLIDTFPWVDYVVVGEAERTMSDLTTYLRSKSASIELDNVAYRLNGNLQFKRSARGRLALDNTPPPAHDLVPVRAYFKFNRHSMLSLEHARGCQLRCSYCYSEVHWGHGETKKSTERIIEEMVEAKRCGAELLFFVADNFLTNGRDAERLCAAIEEAKLGLAWKCYATLAQLTPSVIDALRRAGCVSTFIGVDAVSTSNRKAFKKTYFKGWSALEPVLTRCVEAGVIPTCSYMVASSDTREGVEATLRTALLTKGAGGYMYVNSLSTYNETQVHRTKREPVQHSSLKPALVFDTPALNHSNDLARAHPALFPMHQTSAKSDVFDDLVVFSYIAYRLIVWFPRTLMRYVLDYDGSLVGLVNDLYGQFGERLLAGVRLEDEALQVDFVQSFIDRTSMNPRMAAIVDYESMKYFRNCYVVVERIKFNIDGSIRPCVVAPFKLVSLDVAPSALESTKPLSPARLERCFLVGNVDGRLRYLEVDDPLRTVFETLAHGRVEKDEIEIGFDTYQTLKRAEFIEPMFDYETASA